MNFLADTVASEVFRRVRRAAADILQIQGTGAPRRSSFLDQENYTWQQEELVRNRDVVLHGLSDIMVRFFYVLSCKKFFKQQKTSPKMPVTNIFTDRRE